MADDQHISSDDSDIENNQTELILQGILHKWTNYIHGWQDRYIVLKSGTLSYYKSESESGFGCRGALTLAKANIKPHEFDECRFDISVNDCVWYLRADTVENKQRWVDTLESLKAESGYGTSAGTTSGSDTSLRRHGSSVSLQSNTYSTASSGSFKRTGRNLQEKLQELQTFKDILCGQIDTLQRYFDDACSGSAAARVQQIGGDGNGSGMMMVMMDVDKESVEPGAATPPTSAASAIDFKGEAITFRTTTAAVLDTVAHCVDLVMQREEAWKRRLDREAERRKRCETISRTYFDQLQLNKVTGNGGGGGGAVNGGVAHAGPDLEEGPHSVIADDEFYDAVESGLDKMEEEQELRERLKTGKAIPITPPPTSPATQHRLWSEIEAVTKQQVSMARLGVGGCLSGGGGAASGWQLFAEDGEMRMFRREEEVDGMVVDPLKAVHVVKGITGRELCHYFFLPQYRYDWETTLESMEVLETISEDTLLFFQTHKRIWPASQRDTLFWSHMRRLPNDQDSEGPDMWTVVNNSTEHAEHPINSGKCVRIFLTVCLLTQTRVDPPKDGAPISRENISCKITYCSVVNPGGWAPASVLRAVYKREYPKFLKRFTAFVIKQTKDKSIMF